MPRIEQRLIGTSLFMYASREDAEQGRQRGGSGFLVGQPAARIPSRVHVYAVTNAHVVEGGGTVARARRRDGQSQVFSDSEWECHPDGEDVAVSWLSTAPADEDQQLQWVPRDWLATEADLGLVTARKEWGHPWDTGPIVPGEDTFSVTRFIGYDGIDRNQPTVRFGNLASTEVVPISQKPRDHDQGSLLVEARSLSGYSGSPVFAYRGGGYFGGGSPPIDKAVLLGVGWGHIKHPKDERDEYDVEMETPGRPTPGRYNSGVMAVVPAWMLGQLLDDPKVVTVRSEHEQKATEDSGAEMDAAGEDEFKRFEDLTRELVNTPKPDKDKDES